MTTLREAAQQALEALELLQNAIYNIGGEHVTGWDYANYAADSAEKPITTLKAALAEPVEPVAWWKRHRDGSVELNDARTFIAEDAIATGRRPLIFGDTSPPQRPAEPDTDCHAQGICQRSGYGIN